MNEGRTGRRRWPPLRHDGLAIKRTMVDLSKVKGLSDWPKTRELIEAAVVSVMGKPCADLIDVQVKTVDETDIGGVTRKRVIYFVDEWTRMSAWLFEPDGVDSGPAIVCCHRQISNGKDEPAGIEGDAALAFAKRYSENGYVTIAPDTIGAGERISPGLEAFDTAMFYKDHPKQSAMGKMLVDHMRCVDVLQELPSVDPSRVGVMGHDMGAYNALFLTAFDERVQTCVASCGFTCFEGDDDPMRWARSDGLVLMPKLKAALARNELPFEWDQVLAMLAPSPALIISASNDEVLSNTSSCEKAFKRAQRVYKFLGAEDAIAHLVHKGGHRMTQEASDAADEWFDRWL